MTARRTERIIHSPVGVMRGARLSSETKLKTRIFKTHTHSLRNNHNVIIIIIIMYQRAVREPSRSASRCALRLRHNCHSHAGICRAIVGQIVPMSMLSKFYVIYLLIVRDLQRQSSKLFSLHVGLTLGPDGFVRHAHHIVGAATVVRIATRQLALIDDINKTHTDTDTH